MRLLGDIDPDEFLTEYWQRRPLLVRGALSDAPGLIDGDVLAGLACEDDATARLVHCDPSGAVWHCEHGPFDAARFEALPASHWTLLVQGVDTWLPELARLRESADFLPRWRLDDIMVSYAVPGGGVGPHFDHYDVFLLQSRGTRLWQIGGRCNDATPLLEHPELRLLANFQPVEEHRLDAGDLLYLPAGLAHQGTAVSEDCMTCSIGFRAPSHAEILRQTVEELCAALSESERFTDTAPHGGGGDRDRLDRSVESTLAAIWAGLSPESVRDAAVRGFGRLVTEPGARETDARSAFRAVENGAELYVDGECYRTSLAFARAWCAGQVLPADDLDADDLETRRLLESRGVWPPAARITEHHRREGES